MTAFLSELQALHHYLFIPERIPLAMAALLLAALVGVVTGPLWGNASPLFWIVVNKVLGGFGAKLDRVQRKPGDLMIRGFVLTLIGLLIFYAAGRGATVLVQAFPLSGVTEIICLSLVLTAGSAWYALLKLFFALKEKKVGNKAYYAIATSTRTNLAAADNFTITRIGMGWSARIFDKGVVAPIIWFLIGGLPAAYIYAGLAALSWRFGRDGFTKGFGRIPLALEQLMGYGPMLLSGILMAGAGLLTPTGGMTRAFAGLLRKEGAAPYAEGGLPVTAMANSLNVSLGGPVIDLDGSTIKRTWAGPKSATAQLGEGHLGRALYISLMAHLLFLAAMGASLLYAGRFFG